jgi:hypothetical protein
MNHLKEYLPKDYFYFQRLNKNCSLVDLKPPLALFVNNSLISESLASGLEQRYKRERAYSWIKRSVLERSAYKEEDENSGYLRIYKHREDSKQKKSRMQYRIARLMAVATFIDEYGIAQTENIRNSFDFLNIYEEEIDEYQKYYGAIIEEYFSMREETLLGDSGLTRSEIIKCMLENQDVDHENYQDKKKELESITAFADRMVFLIHNFFDVKSYMQENKGYAINEWSYHYWLEKYGKSDQVPTVEEAEEFIREDLANSGRVKVA